MGRRDRQEWPCPRGADPDVRRGTAGSSRATSPVRTPAGAPEGDYDDPTAVLTGPWGRNQYAKGRVFSRNQTEEYFQEVELRLRSTIAPHVARATRCSSGA